MDKQAVLEATRGEIRDFIVKDYGRANEKVLAGMQGVRILQRALRVTDDGHFGPETFGALIEYQKSE